MYPPPVGGTRSLGTLLGHVDGLADPGRRQEATSALARESGGQDLLLFARDPELDVLLPAPGLRQVLRDAAGWRRFLDACVAEGESVGEVPAVETGSVRAWGCAHPDGGVAVLTGDSIRSGPALLRPLLPLLAALFRSERQVMADEVRARSAAAAVERADVLNTALQGARRRLQDALVTAEEARVEADRASRAKSDFLAHMSHELRTPINAVLGYTDLLAAGITGSVTDAQLAQLKRIRASGAHLLILVNDVLDMAKVEAGEMVIRRETDVMRDVATEALALVQLEADKRQLTLDAAGLDGDTTFVGDRERVRQILVNLLSNAVKFTEPGGRIILECGTMEGRAFVAVEDDGVGIASEHLASIFDPFVQAHSRRAARRREGTGLGLSLSRRLARMMDGDVEVQSADGVGSRFTLWLPAPTEGADHG